MSRGFVAVCLYRIKTHWNLGGALRAAGCFDANLMVLAKSTLGTSHLPTDTAKAWKHTPTIQTDDPFDALPLGAVPVAIEIADNATPLPRYVHPERAFYIFGPEGGSLPNDIMKKCRDRVILPTAHCLNLSACVNIVLYDRLCKSSAWDRSATILGHKGGTARAKNLTPERRSEIASLAAKKRWTF